MEYVQYPFNSSYDVTQYNQTCTNWVNNEEDFFDNNTSRNRTFYTKDHILHQFTVGNGGKNLNKICLNMYTGGNFIY